MTRALRVCAIGAAVCIAGGATSSAATPPGSLYARDCQRCHGADGEGREPDGPPLEGISQAAVDLYLLAGYMPLGSPSDAPRRRTSPYAPADLDALVGYVASRFAAAGTAARDPGPGDVEAGFQIFARDCAGCHGATGRGGEVVGAVAPALLRATPRQMVEAIRTGAYVMPVFGPSRLSDREVDSVVAYIGTLRHPADPGGAQIGLLGPVPEGLVAWLIGGIALVALARIVSGPVR